MNYKTRTSILGLASVVFLPSVAMAATYLQVCDERWTTPCWVCKCDSGACDCLPLSRAAQKQKQGVSSAVGTTFDTAKREERTPSKFPPGSSAPGAVKARQMADAWLKSSKQLAK